MDLIEANGVLALYQQCPAAEWHRIRVRDTGLFNQLAFRFMQAKCVADFRNFLWFGAYMHARKHYRGRLFDRMATFLQESSHKIRFMVVAREHRKTQMLMAYKVWRLVQDQNRTVLIRAFQKKPNAQDIARGMQEIMESDRFKHLFPWVQPELKSGTRSKEMWSKEGMLLKRSDVGKRVPSVAVHGFESDPTGGHFTDQLCDDLAVQDSEKENIRPQLYEKFKNDDNLMLAGAQRDIAGTIWAYRGFMDCARLHKGQFEDMDYDLFFEPAEVQVLPAPLTGDTALLCEDRLHLKLKHLSSELPSDNGGVAYCQAKITFESENAGDTTVVAREIEVNSANEIRLNRPIETIHGDKVVAWQIGNYRPAAPSLFTMDTVDLMAPLEMQDHQVNRASLPAKRKSQGSHVYAAQMLLNPRASDECLFDSQRLRWIARGDFDDIVKHTKGTWFRKCDLSSAKRTGSFTAMTLGYVCDRGVFVRRMFWGLPKTHIILLELFRGYTWLRTEYDAFVRHVQFEKAHIENTVRENLDAAMKDPYAYFMLYKDCESFAKAFLSQGRPIFIPLHEVSRGEAGKVDRINHHLSPLLEQERLYVVEDIEHTDRLTEEMDGCTLESEVGIDLLETVGDLCAEFRLPEIKKETDRPRGAEDVSFDEIQFDALRRNRRFALTGTRWRY